MVRIGSLVLGEEALPRGGRDMLSNCLVDHRDELVFLICSGSLSRTKHNTQIAFIPFFAAGSPAAEERIKEGAHDLTHPEEPRFDRYHFQNGRIASDVVRIRQTHGAGELKRRFASVAGRNFDGQQFLLECFDRIEVSLLDTIGGRKHHVPDPCPS